MAKLPKVQAKKKVLDAKGKLTRAKMRKLFLKTPKAFPQLEIDAAMKWLLSPSKMRRERALFSLWLQAGKAGKALPLLERLQKKETDNWIKFAMRRVIDEIKIKKASFSDE